MGPNNREGICYKQPTDLVERMNIAFDFRDAFEYAIPLVIDRMDNEAMTQYSGWPERLYIIDEHGRIAYKGHAGPFRYRPGEVETWLAKRFPHVTAAAGSDSP